MSEKIPAAFHPVTGIARCVHVWCTKRETDEYHEGEHTGRAEHRIKNALAQQDQSVLIDGYCFELPEYFKADAPGAMESHFGAQHWLLADNEDWATQVVTRIRAVRELGQKRVDGHMCLVFLCDDGRVRAVVMTAAVARRRPLEARP